jgi:hypothetical protein
VDEVATSSIPDQEKIARQLVERGEKEKLERENA